MAARGWTTDVKVEEDGFDPARCSDIAKQLVSPVFQKVIPDICHFFYAGKILENKIYTKKKRKLGQNTQ